jgi:CheY-like chemotaxis protein
MRLEGYDVTAVASVSEALHHVQKGNGVDLLICDYHLEAGQRASEVIATLRQMVGVPLRTIVVTGDASLQSGRSKCQDFKNSSPEAKPCAVKPAARRTRTTDFRTESSSSTTAITVHTPCS